MKDTPYQLLVIDRSIPFLQYFILSENISYDDALFSNIASAIIEKYSL